MAKHKFMREREALDTAGADGCGNCGEEFAEASVYQDWQAGKLSRGALQLYAAQYYKHVEAFPKHLRVLAARTEGPLQGLIRENLAKRKVRHGQHPKLWPGFCGGRGSR